MITDAQAIHIAQLQTLFSKDESRKTGCVIILDDTVLTAGYNAFPHGVAVTDARKRRPAKYAFTEHAERNAIYLAARDGVKLDGATAFLTWFPCADCARALVQSGIVRLVCFEPNWAETQYSFQEASVILSEGGVAVVYAVRATGVAQ